jgi:hypothetical protein
LNSSNANVLLYANDVIVSRPAALVEFGARNGNPHAFDGIVLGFFGEIFNSCCSLCTAIARAGAALVVSC